MLREGPQRARIASKKAERLANCAASRRVLESNPDDEPEMALGEDGAAAAAVFS